MKKFLLQLFVGLGLGLAGVAAGNAQTSVSYRAHIPFDFTIDNVSLKAGDYRVGPLSGSTDLKTLRIQSVEDGYNKLLGFATVGPLREDVGAKLVFARSGTGYSLADVETPTFAFKAKRPRPSVKITGSLEKEPETVTLALQ